MSLSQCVNLWWRSDVVGHQPPRRTIAIAAEVPLITDNSLRSAGPRCFYASRDQSVVIIVIARGLVPPTGGINDN